MSERVRDVLLNLVVAGGLLGDRRAHPASVDTRRQRHADVAGRRRRRSRRCSSAAHGCCRASRSVVPHDGRSACRSGRRCSSPAAAPLEAIIDVTLLRRFAFDQRLERTRDVVLLGLVVAPVGASSRPSSALRRRSLAGAYPAERLSVFPGALVAARTGSACRSSSRWRLTWARSRPIDWTWPRIAEGVALSSPAC